jgi:hypothetical protein
MANLTCAECGFVNEAERVYCHNCGKKLDRSLIPKEEPKAGESAAKARKRIHKMTNPGASPVMREAKALLRTLFWAATAACLILASRKPDGVPDTRAELGSRMIQGELLDAVSSPGPRAVAFTEAEINQHFRTLKAKEGVVPGVRFERAFVNLLPAVVRTSAQYSLWGYPFYAGISHRLEVKNGQFTPTLVGGNFGRLRVHPAIMQYIDWGFRTLWPAFKREQDHMQKMQSITIEKGKITMITRPPGR